MPVPDRTSIEVFALDRDRARVRSARRWGVTRTLAGVTTPFEFRISVVSPDWLVAHKGADALRELNTLGTEGWQLAAVFSNPGENLVSVVLQRPREVDR